MGQFRIDFIKKPRGNDKSTVTNLTRIYLMSLYYSDRTAFEELLDTLKTIKVQEEYKN